MKMGHIVDYDKFTKSEQLRCLQSLLDDKDEFSDFYFDNHNKLHIVSQRDPEETHWDAVVKRIEDVSNPIQF